MSELIDAASGRKHSYGQLLATVSALALLSSVTAQGVQAAGDDADRPTVWIELGGQLERVSGMNAPFVFPFMSDHADSPTFKPVSPLEMQRSPRYSKGFEGKIAFTPDSSDWVFSAAIRYGRANGNKRIHQQTPGRIIPSGYLLHNYAGFDHVGIKAAFDARSKDRESHTILDFKAGRDVGLGALGRNSRTDLSFGVRFAQFTSSKSADLKDRPEIDFVGTVPFKYWTNFVATGQSERSFHGIGPSLSLDGSLPIAGGKNDGIDFDWGLSGAVLFGRQKASVAHQAYASEWHKNGFQKYYVQAYKSAPPRSVRSRSVVVPNIGGFAGLSFHRSSAKVSFGYRADFFFGAMDTGIDSRRKEGVSFHGPFATISIGLGG